MSRIEKEKQTVEQMIRLYCRKKEGNETAFTLSVRRREINLSDLYRALL